MAAQPTDSPAPPTCEVCERDAHHVHSVKGASNICAGCVGANGFVFMQAHGLGPVLCFASPTGDGVKLELDKGVADCVRAHALGAAEGVTVEDKEGDLYTSAICGVGTLVVVAAQSRITDNAPRLTDLQQCT